MIKENLNYSVSDNKVTIDISSLKGNKVIDATITLQAVTFTSYGDVTIVANFVDGAGEVIWENVDTITIKSVNSPFIVNVSDEIQHAIDNNLESATIQFTTTNTTAEWVLDKVENRAYEDIVYMSVNEFMKNSAKHSVSLNSAGNLSVDLVNGMMFLERSVLPLRTNALMLNLKHIYTSYFEDIKSKYGLHSNCGTNWKLSTEQYLIEKSETELIYLNEYGQEERLVEEYYYLDDNKEKVYVNKDDVAYDISGALKYNDEDVYTECKTSTGLKLVTDKKDIKGAEYVDLEPEELAQIRAQSESIESAIAQLEKTISQSEQQLCYQVILLKGITKDQNLTIQQVFINKITDYLTEIKNNQISKMLDAGKLNTICGQLGINNDTHIDASEGSQSVTLNLQINSYIDNLTTYYQQLETYQVQQKKIAYQLKIYEEQTPLYYLYSDNVIYGFSKLEVEDKTENSTDIENSGTPTSETTEDETIRYTLTYISDYYGNTLILKYDTGTYTGYEKDENIDKGTYNLLYIVDQNENIITFNYKDGLLNNIVDSKENKYEFEYTNGYFHTFSISGNITARYIYNTANQLVGIVDKNGIGCLLGYNSSTNKVETIKPLSALKHIQGQQHEFKTDLNLINSSNIEDYVLDTNDFVKIDYYDYKSTSISSVKLVEPTAEDGNVEKVEQINKTVTYIFDQYGNTKTTYLNEFDENSPDNNSAYVQNFDYISDKITFSSKPYPAAENFLSEVCFSETPTYQAENFLGDDLITGDCILCASTPMHTAYHTLTTSANAKDSIEVPNTLVLNKISKKISCLTLSGWAKANSGFVINEDNENKEYSDYVKNRKFEIGAIITYSDNTTMAYKKSFDYMNTGWQFVAVPILLDTSKEITKIECYIDYSNNNGNIQYSDLILCESQYTINEYKGDLLDKSYSSDSKFGRKYEYKDEQLSKVYYIEKDLLINNEYELKKIDLFDRFEYNLNGKLWRTTDYNGIVTEKVFDSNGIETKSLTYHKDNPAEIFYSEQKVDEHGNVVADYNELGDEVSGYTYDSKSGNVVSVKDSSNAETSYGYSKDGTTLLQTTTNINGLNNSTTYGYTLDFLTKLSHNDFDITYDYDRQGRTTKISVADSEYATFEYDDKTTITKFKQNGEDKTIETTLDNEGNLYSVEYNNNALIRNYYSTHNQLLGYDDELIGEEVEHKYDSKGNLTETIKNNASFNTHITTTKENDTKTITHLEIKEHQTSGDVTLANLDYTYNYDESIDNNLTSVTLPNGTVQNIRLDKLGRTKEIINGNFTKQYSYLTKGNHTSNLVSAEWFGKNNVIRENLHYAYDEKGNITEIKENGKLIARYSYDALSRLVREDNAILNKTITISYDEGGNILNKSEYDYTLKSIEAIENNSSFNYDYRSNGWKDQLMSYNGETFEYDELGNPTTYRNHNLGWNYGRRLMSYDNINYTYDANGIRHIKTVNGVTTHYFTNGTQILGQFDGNLMLFYYGVDGISGFSYNGTNYTYKKNILGDIIGIYKEDVEIVRYSYDAWGKHRTFILNGENFVDIEEEMDYTGLTSDEQLVINDRRFIAEINPFRYRGYYYDVETGLYYLNSRYYDPEIGRFINSDDISILNTAKDEINGLNLYAYCFNNPINDTDSNGNWSWKKFWKKTLKVVAVVAVVVAVTTITIATAGVGGTLIASGIGATIGALSYTGSYLITGMASGSWNWSWGDFLGSTLGGAIGGMIGIGMSQFISATIGAFASSILSDAFNNIIYGEKFHLLRSLKDGLILGLIAGASSLVVSKIISIKSLNRGRGSWSQISQQIYTKFQRNLISGISSKTFFKMFGLELYNSSLEFIINIVRG